MTEEIVAGNWVKVVRMIEVNDEKRNSEKRLAIGSTFRVRDVKDVPRFEGHVYGLEVLTDKVFYRYRFHRDELELASGPDAAPPVGSFVRLFGSSEVVKVQRIASIAVVAEDGKVGQLHEILSEEECEQHKCWLAAQAKQKRADDRAALLKKRDEVVASAKKMLKDASHMMAEASKMTEELAAEQPTE